MLKSHLYRKLGGIGCSSIAVIGDVILDHYLTGEMSRISPEAPVGVLDAAEESWTLGGAANVARNISKLGCKVHLVGVVGKDDAAKILNNLLKQDAISTSGIFVDGKRPTIKKTRLMANGQQLMRVDREKRTAISAEVEKKLIAHIEKNIKRYDGIILSDYNKGVLTNSLLKRVIAIGRKSGIIIITDPKGADFSKYRGVTYITPNLPELEAASGMACGDDKAVERAAKKLIKSTGVKYILATRGSQGMALVTSGGSNVACFPAEAREVYDVTGAGDTVVAVFAWGLLGGLPAEEAAALSNYAGGLQVAHLGAVPVTHSDLEQELSNAPKVGESKVIGLAEAADISASLSKAGKKVVFTNGCFDLIHYGHIKYLQEAKALGDLLILGLNSDASLKRLKGEGRPVINEHDRAHILAALDCVDYVVVFGEPTPIKLIRAIKPALLVKGGDYKIEQIVGYKDLKKWGGRATTIRYIAGSSTTGLIQKIKRGS